MPQLKIIVLAHPAMWNTRVKDIRSLEKSFLSLNDNHKSWNDIRGERGERKGIYKVKKLNDHPVILAKFISDCSIKEDHPCMEKILRDEGCLSDDIEIPVHIPGSQQAQLYFDLQEGICYMYSQGQAPRKELVIETLLSLQDDLRIPTKNMSFFEWEVTLAVTVTEIARKKGYEPYTVRADLETVTVTAQGNLEDDEDWIKIRDAIDLDKWKNVAYVDSKADEVFIFGLSRKFRKRISIPYIKETSSERIYSKILEVREIIEQALGENIRRVCFPEQIKILDEF